MLLFMKKKPNRSSPANELKKRNPTILFDQFQYACPYEQVSCIYFADDPL